MARSTLNVAEAAEMLGLSEASIYVAVRKGEIPSVRIGKRWLIPRHYIDKLIGGSTAEVSSHEKADADAA